GCAIYVGEVEQAFQAYYANLLLTERTGPEVRHGFVIANLAVVLCSIGRTLESITLLEQLLRDSQATQSNRFLWVVARVNLAISKTLSGHDKEALADLEQLLAAGVHHEFPAHAVCVFENLAHALIDL